MTKVINIFIISLTIYSSIAFSSWQARIQEDKMTDRKFMTAATQSTNKVWAGKNARLEVSSQCGFDEFQIFLTHPYVVGDGPVDIRFDKDKSEKVYATKCANSKCLIIGDKSTTDGIGAPKEILTKMKTSKKMLIQYNDATSTTYLAEFSVSGLSTQLDKIRKKCK